MCPATPTWPPSMTWSPSVVLPAMPTWAASSMSRPIATPWRDLHQVVDLGAGADARLAHRRRGRWWCWRRSRRRPRSRRCRPAGSSRACRRRAGAKPKPSPPITAPFWTTTRSPSGDALANRHLGVDHAVAADHAAGAEDDVAVQHAAGADARAGADGDERPTVPAVEPIEVLEDAVLVSSALAWPRPPALSRRLLQRARLRRIGRLAGLLMAIELRIGEGDRASERR